MDNIQCLELATLRVFLSLVRWSRLTDSRPFTERGGTLRGREHKGPIDGSSLESRGGNRHQVSTWRGSLCRTGNDVTPNDGEGESFLQHYSSALVPFYVLRLSLSLQDLGKETGRCAAVRHTHGKFRPLPLHHRDSRFLRGSPPTPTGHQTRFVQSNLGTSRAWFKSSSHTKYVSYCSKIIT